MKKTLVVDGQILQTNAWHRGMGKYTLQVLKQLNDSVANNLDVSVVFNNGLKTDISRFESIESACPNIKFLHYDLPITSDKESTSEEYVEVLSNLIKKDFNGSEVFYLLTSLFYFDYFAEFPDKCNKLLLFYDLTPYMFWKDLGGYFPEEIYMSRFETILEADHIFAISETTRQDVLNIFGLPDESVSNINGGFTKIAESTKKPTNFIVPKEYVLFPTGDLPHKNNEIAVRGFEHYFRNVDKGIPMLITSHFHDNSKNQLKSLSNNIIFTDNVTDPELEWLFENSSAVVFASKYEGLGLPVLDAVASDKPIVASNIRVFKEMSESAFYYFNQSDHKELAKALTSALRKDNLSYKLKRYPPIIEKYSWAKTSKGITDYTNKPVQSRQITINIKPKVAVICLHPGIDNQIGRKAESLLYIFKQHFDVEFYFDPNGKNYREMERPTYLDYSSSKTMDIAKLTKESYKYYDLVIYLLDDMSLPSRLAQRASIFGGVAIVDFRVEDLDDQRKMFKELIIDNQKDVFTISNYSYAEYEHIIELINSSILKGRQNE